MLRYLFYMFAGISYIAAGTAIIFVDLGMGPGNWELNVRLVAVMLGIAGAIFLWRIVMISREG